MKETGVLFSGDMVRALLEGRKTQTRRVVRPQPEKLEFWAFEEQEFMDRCPYGKPGDLLWVRETWTAFPCECCDEGFSYRPCTCTDPPTYRADRTDWDDAVIRWRPSIHMPRWASRITLRITGVKIERLQEISCGDVFAEGVKPYEGCTSNEDASAWDPVEHFRSLWDSLNPNHPWESDPWVFAITFEKT